MIGRKKKLNTTDNSSNGSKILINIRSLKTCPKTQTYKNN